MSIDCSSRTWRESKHHGAALLALLCLADHANDDGVCWPSVKRVAERARVIERHGKRLVLQLVESGEVYREIGGGRGNSNLFFVCVGLGDVEILRVLMDRKWFGLSPIAARGALSLIREQQAKFAAQASIEKGDTTDTLYADAPNSDTEDTLLENSDISEQKGDTPARKGDVPVQKGDTPARKGDIAMSLEPSLTVIQPSVESNEPAAIPEKDDPASSREQAKAYVLKAMHRRDLNGDAKAFDELWKSCNQPAIYKQVAEQWSNLNSTRAARFKDLRTMVGYAVARQKKAASGP